MVKFVEAAFRQYHMKLVELNLFLSLVILMFINFFVEAVLISSLFHKEWI